MTKARELSELAKAVTIVDNRIDFDRSTQFTGTFASTGIDDNASSTAITINSSQDVTLTGSLIFADNEKAIFGAGSDLQIYHDGSNSIVQDVGTGNLELRGTNLRLTNAGGNELYLNATQNGDVDLYYDSAVKLSTTSTGIDVTGTAVTDGLNVLAGNGVIGTAQINRDNDGLGGVSGVALTLANDGTSAGTGVSLRLSPADVQTAARGSLLSSTLEGTNGSNIELWTVVNGQSPHKSMEIDGNGDISFYEDTGTTPKLFWDASEERLGIGTSSPSFDLELNKSSAPTIRIEETTNNVRLDLRSNSDHTLIRTTSNHDMRFNTNQVDRMTIKNNGNVGIGTSSPSVPSGTGLVVHNASVSRFKLTVDATGQTSTDGFELTASGSDAFINNRENGNLILYTNNTEAMRIDSSGNVGIGTSSPNINHKVTIVDVTGNGGGTLGLNVSTSGTSDNLGRLHFGNATDPVLCAIFGIADGASDAGALTFRTEATGEALEERMRIDSSGNVGIGISSNIARKLHVQNDGDYAAKFGGTGAGDYSIEIGQIGASGSAGLNATGNNGAMKFMISGSEKMRIAAPSGNVGIGTTSPQGDLDVRNDTNQTVIIGNSGNYAGGEYGRLMFKEASSELAYLQWNGTGNEFRLMNRVGILTFGTSNNEKMRIDTNGNVGINESSPDTKLHVSDNVAGTPLATFECTASHEASIRFKSAHSSSSDFRIGASISASNNFEIYSVGAAATRLQIDSNGLLKSIPSYNNTTGSSANVVIFSDGQFARSTSSLRYKNTINDATHGLTELLTLRPVTYKGNNDGDTIFGGLIAEEVHDAGLTEFVQYNDDDEPDSLAYGNMVSLCIKAIQELKAELDSAKARITALENG